MPWATELRRCPWSQIAEDSWAAFRWWSDWKAAGMLPFPGGIDQQPAYVTESILVCEGEINRSRNEQQRASIAEIEQRRAGR